MDVVETFGNIVSKEALKDGEKARKLLLAGYHAQAFKLKHIPEKGLMPSGNEVAEIIMNRMIAALSYPEKGAMVSIFVPGELLCAAGLTPYSVEALSAFLAGTRCEQPFLAKTVEEGFPETMCSFHRTFLGASLTNLVPKPKCMIYTNLACDGNMMTFPYLKRHYGIPAFYIEVPYERSKESVRYVADQLREAKSFLEGVTGNQISDEKLEETISVSRKTSEYYEHQLACQATHALPTTLTNELYAVLVGHLLMGTEDACRYAKQLSEDIERAPKDTGLKVLWLHVMPFLQPAAKSVFNLAEDIHIKACDFVCDGFRESVAEDPFEMMAEKMVYSIYNGNIDGRIAYAKKLAKMTEADGCILYAHWGCKATVGGALVMKRALEEAGIPTLILDGDGCNPMNNSDGQIATRLEAFKEMLKENRG